MVDHRVVMDAGCVYRHESLEEVGLCANEAHGRRTVDGSTRSRAVDDRDLTSKILRHGDRLRHVKVEVARAPGRGIASRDGKAPMHWDLLDGEEELIAFHCVAQTPDSTPQKFV